MQKANAKLYLGAALVVAAATSVGAQTPTVEVSGRYQAVDDRSINERFPVGWNADVAVSIDGAWGVVAEVGGAYRSDADLAIDLTVFTFAGGSRWSGWRASRVAPFAQLLLGLARMGSRADIPGGEISVSQTKLMLQPSGGVTIAVGQGWGITSQVGYRRIFLDGDHDGDTGFNELIVSAGVRFRF